MTRRQTTSTPLKSLHALCPHCDTPGAVRTSRQLTPTYKQFYFACRNESCGHSWLAELTVVHSITPSARPRAGLHLRMGPTFAQMLSASAEGGVGITGPPANDDEVARQQG